MKRSQQQVLTAVNGTLPGCRIAVVMGVYVVACHKSVREVEAHPKESHSLSQRCSAVGQYAHPVWLVCNKPFQLWQQRLVSFCLGVAAYL